MSSTDHCDHDDSPDVTSNGAAHRSPATGVYGVPAAPPIVCAVYQRPVTDGTISAAVRADGGSTDAAVPHWLPGSLRTAARIASAIAEAPSSFGCSPSALILFASLPSAVSMSTTWTMPSNSATRPARPALKVATSVSPMPVE